VSPRKRQPRVPERAESALPSPVGIPGEDRDRLTEAETDSAFRWAAGAVGDRDVLVVGCGRGHGARILHEAGARSVTGTDADPRSVDIASHLYGERLSFTVAESNALPFAAASFGAVACFDAPAKSFDAEASLAELERVLAANGILLVSMPLYRAPLEPPSDSGVDPATPEEGVSDLCSRFTSVRSYRRRLAVAAIVTAEGANGDADQLRATSRLGDGGEDRTLLVAASNGLLPELPELASMISFRDLRTQQETLAAWEERARRAEADGTAKHWELVAAREAQRRLRMRLHAMEHTRLRKLGRILRGKPATLSEGPKVRSSERKRKRWE
jgi:SAM-dependent methyltransferase